MSNPSRSVKLSVKRDDAETLLNDLRNGDDHIYRMRLDVPRRAAINEIEKVFPELAPDQEGEDGESSDGERESARECPECGEEGHQAWVLGHWHCPDCDLTYDDSGSTDVRQI